MHPCVRRALHEKAADGGATYTIRYQHVVITATGRCKVCDESLAEMPEDGATISRSEDQAKANKS